MGYTFELQNTSKCYAITAKDGKEYTLSYYYFENIGWANITVFDPEKDKDISDTDIGKAIIKEFKKEEVL